MKPAVTRYLRLLAAVLLTTCGGGDASGPSVARVEVSGRPSLRVGETLRFTAVAYDAGNQQLGDVAFNWSSDHPAIASVDADGTVHAADTGQVSITASASGMAD